MSNLHQSPAPLFGEARCTEPYREEKCVVANISVGSDRKAGNNMYYRSEPANADYRKVLRLKRYNEVWANRRYALDGSQRGNSSQTERMVKTIWSSKLGVNFEVSQACSESQVEHSSRCVTKISCHNTSLYLSEDLLFKDESMLDRLSKLFDAYIDELLEQVLRRANCSLVYGFAFILHVAILCQYYILCFPAR